MSRLRSTALALASALPLAYLACSAPVRVTPPPADAPAELVALTGAAVLIGTGDIARCNENGDELTAALVDSVLKADSIADVEDAVFTTGDNTYPGGSERDFELCFTPSWGDSAKRIMKKIRPTPGNHEHESDEAAPYYKYFGDAAGSPRKGYYSFSLGEWHVIALNSEIVVNRIFTAKERLDQEEWLREDLKKTSRKCVVAYWHHPMFSSGWHGGDSRIGVIWKILQDGGGDVIITGHDHHYERFHQVNPAGVRDSTGMVQFVIGTGGGGLRNLRSSISPTSAFRLQGYYGVLKLTLGAGEWRSAFIDATGRTWDHAGGRCR